jgi:1-deoxy-D-xylulose-5-phosphate synthase
MAPRDEAELQRMLKTAFSLDSPSAIRFPRGAGVGVPLYPSLESLAPLEIGRSELLRQGSSIGRAGSLGQGDELAIIALGSMVEPSLEAADSLAREGIAVSVLDARFVKPLDSSAILALARRTRRILTVEEGALAGGFGGAVAELIAERAAGDGIELTRLGLPDEFLDHGTQAALRARVGLDAPSIARAARAALPLRHLLAVSA